MKNYRILDRYIIAKYIVTFLTMLTLFIPISVLVDLSQKIDNFKQYEVPASEILWYYYNFIWHFGFILFPIFLFLSVIWFTSKLSSNSEVIAILSSGISFYRYLRPFFIAALLISLGAFFAGQFIVPKASKSLKEFEFSYFKKNKKDRQTQLLFKQIDDGDYIYLSQFNPTRQFGYNFSYESFEGNNMQYKISARNIRWIEDDQVYRLTDYFKRTFDGEKEIIESKSRLDTIMPFAFDELSPLDYTAQTLTMLELNRFIAKEEESGSPLINRHLLVRHKRWSIMVAAFILTIIGVSVSSFKRRGGIGMNLALGVIVAFLYIFFDKIFEVMVEKSNFTAALAAWIPNLIFGIFSLVLLRYAKR
jgi:lipopolysaccharide export system permease protein